jgi:ribosomal protein S18 acetylase RimI-like enzyme
MRAVLSHEVGIRRVTADDERFVGALSREAFAPFSRHAEGTTQRMLREPGSTTLVATHDEKAVGFVVVEHHGRGLASIQAIAVDPAERAKGVGQRLMTAAIRLAREGGARELRLCTAQANVEALALFLRAGFRIVRRMPRFYPRGQDACELSRSI